MEFWLIWSLAFGVGMSVGYYLGKHEKEEPEYNED